MLRDIERQIKSVRLKEKACGDVESHFRPFSSIFAKSKKMGYGRTDGRIDGPTDGPTDRRTDRRTDIPSYRDAWTHLKMQKIKTCVSSSPLRKVLFRSKAITERHMEFSPVLQPRRKEHFLPADS